MKTKMFTIFDGVKVITGKETIVVSGPTDLWNLFGWDIKNDPNAKECASMITRELFCFGKIDLTAMYNGRKLMLEAIPAKESEVE